MSAVLLAKPLWAYEFVSLNRESPFMTYFDPDGKWIEKQDELSVRQITRMPAWGYKLSSTHISPIYVILGSAFALNEHVRRGTYKNLNLSPTQRPITDGILELVERYRLLVPTSDEEEVEMRRDGIEPRSVD